jgi:hypothetical protein
MTQQIQIETNEPKATTNKYALLVLGFIFDAIGMISYIVPGIAEFIDIIWAPISSMLLAKMYKGTTGKVAAMIGFLEEILPGLDIIPTFTITWFYVYGLKKN